MWRRNMAKDSPVCGEFASDARRRRCLQEFAGGLDRSAYVIILLCHNVLAEYRPTRVGRLAATDAEVEAAAPSRRWRARCWPTRGC